jgi:hypothetical protein
VQGLAALNDLLITAALCYSLSDNRSGFSSQVAILALTILLTILLQNQPNSGYADIICNEQGILTA